MPSPNESYKLWSWLVQRVKKGETRDMQLVDVVHYTEAHGCFCHWPHFPMAEGWGQEKTLIWGPGDPNSSFNKCLALTRLRLWTHAHSYRQRKTPTQSTSQDEANPFWKLLSAVQIQASNDNLWHGFISLLKRHTSRINTAYICIYNVPHFQNYKIIPYHISKKKKKNFKIQTAKY